MGPIHGCHVILSSLVCLSSSSSSIPVCSPELTGDEQGRELGSDSRAGGLGGGL